MTDLITAAMVAALSLPPAAYDHEPAIRYNVVTVSASEIERLCPARREQMMLGCYFDWYDHTILVRDDLTDDARARVLRHEKGHVNGWSHR